MRRFRLAFKACTRRSRMARRIDFGFGPQAWKKVAEQFERQSKLDRSFRCLRTDDPQLE